MSRIEQVISEIEDYIEECRPSAFSASKIIVQKEELEEKLSELRMAIPEELDQSKKILSNQNAIMLDARARSKNRFLSRGPAVRRRRSPSVFRC